MKPINECKTVRELLAGESRWTTRYYARDNGGYGIFPKSTHAVCFCLSGAVLRIYGEGEAAYAVNDRLLVAIHKRTREAIGVATFNDVHGYKAVMAVVKEAGV
jgi:hypothetical protein